MLKIPLHAGFTCPNIDGTRSRGGCIYCDNVAFSPVAASTESVMAQLEKGISRGKKRFDAFIGYFQSYSNTHAPAEVLRKKYEPVISHPDVIGIAVGTRPDCFSPEIYDYLSEVNQRTYLSVELGIQTIHNDTLREINRGHTFEESLAAIHELANRNIEVVVHVMLGLPGETRAMMLQTAEQIARLPIQGIKIHQLMVVKGTVLEKQYFSAGKLAVLELEEYAELLGQFLIRLRPDQVIHRLMADSKFETGLIAPQWSADKRCSLSFIQNFLQKNNFYQGNFFRK